MLSCDYLLSEALKKTENTWYTTKKDSKYATLVLTILQVVKPIFYFIDLILVAPTHAFSRKYLFQSSHVHSKKKKEPLQQKALKTFFQVRSNLNVSLSPLLLLGSTLLIIGSVCALHLNRQ